MLQLSIYYTAFKIIFNDGYYKWNSNIKFRDESDFIRNVM